MLMEMELEIHISDCIALLMFFPSKFSFLYFCLFFLLFVISDINILRERERERNKNKKQTIY